MFICMLVHVFRQLVSDWMGSGGVVVDSQIRSSEEKLLFYLDQSNNFVGFLILKLLFLLEKLVCNCIHYSHQETKITIIFMDCSCSVYYDDLFVCFPH